MIDEPLFGAADVANVLDEKETTVRRWHHSGFSRCFGRKSDYAVRYSARDIAGFAVARDLVKLKFPPPLAARVGAVVMRQEPAPDAVLAGTPDQIAAIGPDPGSGVMADRCNWRAPSATTTAITIPVGRIWRDVIDKAARIGAAR
ncbi:hypothetical protein [Shinella fusca]|uniref:HTH merR-type domain-containing protein n=1 Tax=Shinella fusca TaxID=544480 RepID=A0A7W7YQW2_9HYPH|nr:hypothetical protein [Shinella fusca]MBB5040688.1 hypothetical protein [Shinella fusca]